MNSPNNPTGWTISRDEQRILFEHCRRHGIWILADDVYERLIYRDGLRAAPSFLTLAEEGDRVIGVNSFSKAWRMTGWRVGWMVVPPSVLPHLACLIEYNTSCIPEFVQRAASGCVATWRSRCGEPAIGVDCRTGSISSTDCALFPASRSLNRTGRCMSFCGSRDTQTHCNWRSCSSKKPASAWRPAGHLVRKAKDGCAGVMRPICQKLHLGLERLATFLAR